MGELFEITFERFLDEIKIEKFEAKAKLSQNHSIERQKMVINELEKLNTENANSIADWMKNNL